MKRLLIPIVILLVLLVIFELRKLKWVSDLTSTDDGDPPKPESNDHLNPAPFGRSRQSDRREVASGRNFQTMAPRHDRSGSATGNLEGSQGEGPLVYSEMPRHYFIRSSSILKTSEPTEKQAAQIREAVETVLSGLPPEALIFDIDVLNDSEPRRPVLLFAREDLDLTSQVRAAFERIGDEGGRK